MPRALPVLFALALCAGCHVTLNDPGSEPPPGTFYFPSGLTLDPDGTHLYVSNANSDLRYGGGTVQVVDLKRFDCAVRRFQDPGFTDPACPNAADDATVCQADPLD